MVSLENTSMRNIIQTEQVILKSMYVYTYMHLTINEKRDHKFEREQGKVYEKVQMEEKEEINYIIISKITKKL